MTSYGRIKELIESYVENVELFFTVNEVLMRRNLQFLNQARAWFLEIVPVRTSVCVFVCVSAPEAINN